MLRKLILGAILLFALSTTIFVQAQETATVSTTQDDELGTFLVDEAGLTLYIFTPDTPNASNCSDNCLVVWPAYTVGSIDAEIALDGASGNFGIIEREDTGEFQVTYNRMPLYYFVNDTAAGDTNGEGLEDVWFVARRQILALGSNQELGSYLTDSAGNTLYIFTNDEDGVSNCSGDCLSTWPAFTVNNEDELVAGYGVVAQDDLATIEREDTGELQVTYQGQPLYYFANDASAGETNGQGRGDVWFVVNPTPLQSVTTEDMGNILVGRDGTTLYTFANDTDGVSVCVDRCATIWPPLTVESELDLANIGDDMLASISTVEHPNGELQVVYDGQPLYYYYNDAVAGDTNGQGRGDVWFVATSDATTIVETEECRVSPSSNVNLRSGPGTAYAIAGSLLSTDNELVIGQAVDTDGIVWWQIESTAWVRSDLVTNEGNCDGVPTVTAPAPPPTAVPAQPTAEPEQPAAPPPPQSTEES